MGQPGGEPARLHRRDLRAAARRLGYPGAVPGRRADRDRGRHRVRHGGARAGRPARRPDRCPGHGLAPRAVRGPAVVPAHGPEHPAVPRLGGVRAGDDRDGRAHGGARPAQGGVRPDRRAGHRAADHPAAGRHPGPAPVRGRRRAGRHVLPVRAAHPAPAAGAHARHLVRLLGGHRYGRGGGHLVRAAGGRLHPALPQPPGRLRRDHGRLLRHPGALLRHRAARLGHRGARPLAGHLRRVHRAAARRAGLRHLGHAGAGPVVRRRLLHRGLDAEHAPAVGPADPGGHDRRAGHGGRAVAQHRRLRELPGPDRLAVRAAVGGPDHGLLRYLARPLGSVRGGPRPLVHAAALGRRVRHLSAHQSRLRVLVGRGLDLVRPRPRLHPGQLDVGLDPVLRRGRRDHPAGRLAGRPRAPAT